MDKNIELARSFIYKHARPIDLARFQVHFENKDQSLVLNCLSFYQNADGGFAHALEPDSWNIHSSPIQTWCASEILNEIQFDDPKHPIVSGILSFLEHSEHFDGQFWSNTIPTNNNYPHAPWWHYTPDEGNETYNPTAALAGFILKFADKDSSIYRSALDIARRAIDVYLNSGPIDEMHILACYIRLYASIEDKAVFDKKTLLALKDKLIADTRAILEESKSKWASEYVAKPSWFISSKESFLYEALKDLVALEVLHIQSSQLEDGTWPVPWAWLEYLDTWPLAKSYWQADIIVKQLVFCRNFV